MFSFPTLGPEQLVQYAALNKQPHDLDLFIYSPNPTPNFSWSTLLHLTNTYMETVGFTIWVMEEATTGRMQAWPIPPDKIMQTPTPDDPRYTVQTPTGWWLVPMNEVVVFSTPDPTNPYGRGVGFVEALADELGIEQAAAKFVLGFFEQDARPPIIVTGEGLNPEKTKEFKNQWMREQSGSVNTWMPYFASGELKITTLTQDFQSMQMLELRRFERDLIVQIFGIPPEKLGIIQNSNRATSEVADLTFSKEVLLPRLDFFKDVFQKQLIPFFDKSGLVTMGYDSPVMEDKEFQLNVMRSFPYMFTQNQVLKKAGEETIGDPGDLYVVPMTYTTVRDLAELGGLPTAPPATGKETYGELKEIDVSRFKKR